MSKEFDNLLYGIIDKELENMEKKHGKLHLKCMNEAWLLEILWVAAFVLVGIICYKLEIMDAFVFMAIIAVFWKYVMRKSWPSKTRAIALKAKATRDVPFETIIKENLVEEENVNRERMKTAFVIIGSVAVLFCISVLMLGGLKTTVKYVPYENGYMLTSYNQGVFDRTETYTIPSEHNGKKVVAIGEKAFRKENKLKKVIVPDTVVYTDSLIFEKCANLEEVKLSNNLSVMGGGCFKDCKKLKSIVLPDSLKELRGENFYGCKSLETVILPKNITEIKGNTFEYCSSLKSIEIPDGVTRIAAHAFYGCSSLVDVKMPLSVREIGSSAFRQCISLYYIYIPKTAVVNERAFKESPTEIRYLKEEDEIYDYEPASPYVSTSPYSYKY